MPKFCSILTFVLFFSTSQSVFSQHRQQFMDSAMNESKPTEIANKNNLRRLNFKNTSPKKTTILPQTRTVKLSYSGSESSEWVADYSAGLIIFQNIYEGIDLKILGKGLTAQYLLLVKPNANISAIMMQGEGEMTQMGAPKITQEVAGHDQKIEGTYVISNNIVTIQVGNYDSNEPLKIDVSNLCEFFNNENIQKLVK
jgi:hypothetical protein